MLIILLSNVLFCGYWANCWRSLMIRVKLGWKIKILWAFLDWLIWAYPLTEVLWECLREFMKTAYDNFHKLFSTYFHKFSNAAYKNNL